MNNENGHVSKGFTPEAVTELKDNEIFVFGSNRLGKHIGGAARIAKDKFGAKEGIFEGITGRTYAIPTLDENFQKVRESELLFSLRKFLSVVVEDKENVYLLTKIGCGIAGWSVRQVAYIFACALKIVTKGREIPDNLIIPQEFHPMEVEHFRKKKI